MKFLLLLFFLLGFAFSLAADEPQQEGTQPEEQKSEQKVKRFTYAIRISSSHATIPWTQEHPLGFTDDELVPPIFDFGIASTLNGSWFKLTFDTGFYYQSADLKNYNLGLSWDIHKWKNLVFGVSAKYFTPVFGTSAEYYNSIYDHSDFLFALFGQFQWKNHRFKYSMGSISRGTAVISDDEDSETRMEQDQGYNKTSLEWNSSIVGFMTMAEISQFDLGEVRILSRDFSYVIDSATLYRVGFGLGIQKGSTDYWIRFYQFDDPDDELSHYYQAAYFSPDYMLAQQYVQLEIKWNF